MFIDRFWKLREFGVMVPAPGNGDAFEVKARSVSYIVMFLKLGMVDLARE